MDFNIYTFYSIILIFIILFILLFYFKKFILKVTSQQPILFFLIVLLPVMFIARCIEIVQNFITVYRNSIALKTLDARRNRIISFVKNKFAKIDINSKRGIINILPSYINIKPELILDELYMGDFESILDININDRIVTVEPYVSIINLVDALIPYNLTLAVTPSVTNTYIIDLLTGFNCGSSSHLNTDFFNAVIKSLNVVLPNGEIATLSSDLNPTIFHAIKNSLDTFNIIILSVDIKLVALNENSPTTFIELHYWPFHDIQEMVNTLQKFNDNCTEKQPNNLRSPKNDDSRKLLINKTTPDFVEAFLYSRTTGVVVFGYKFDNLPMDSKLSKLDNYYRDWFVSRVEKALHSGEHLEWVQYRDYIKRHDRSLIWEIRDLLPFGDYKLFMPFYGWLIPHSPIIFQYLSDTKSDANSSYVKQNILVPIQHMEAFVDICDEELRIYPLWICPVRNPHSSSSINNLVVNIGIYGRFKSQLDFQRESWRRIEKFLKQIHGVIALGSKSTTFTHSTYEEYIDNNRQESEIYNEVRKFLNLPQFSIYDIIKRN